MPASNTISTVALYLEILFVVSAQEFHPLSLDLSKHAFPEILDRKPGRTFLNLTADNLRRRSANGDADANAPTVTLRGARRLSKRSKRSE